jgi:antitoxin YefM
LYWLTGGWAAGLTGAVHRWENSRPAWRFDQHQSANEWYAIPYHFQGEIMTAMTATDARKGLFSIIQQVNDDHTAIEVVSKRGNAVIISKDDYDAMIETAHLLRNPANAERLLEAIERARRGEFQQHDLLDV